MGQLRAVMFRWVLKDVDDVDAGPNGLLNYPILNSISADGSTTIAYNFDLDVPAGQYRIEFYRDNISGDTNGEGHEFIGFVNVTSAGSDGAESFAGNLTANRNIALGDDIAATATFFTP